MKRNTLFFSVLLGLILVLSSSFISGCSAAPEAVLETEAAVVEPVAAAQVDIPVVLTLVGLEETITYTMEELQALTSASGQAGMKSSTGKITVPWEYKGVLLTDLVDIAGGLSSDYGVNVIANDGYAMTLSYNQIMNGDFIAYDPSDGSEKQYDDPLQVLVAYEANGQPLDERSDGVLRLVIISEKNNQVTDGHWSIKWVERIEIMPLVQEWSLKLNGIRSEVIDRNTFQSCGAASCHQSTWTDDEGQVWSGVPLYLLAGRMDDDTTHDGPAYNRDLANAGYVIELVAGDGYTVSINSADTYYNRKILVANLVDDAPLPDKYFPLRLVGEGLEKDQRIGSISEIRLVIDGLEAAAEPTLATAAPAALAEPPAGTNLWITGLVANPLALTDATLHALQVIEANIEHPKKGPQDYTGVYLNALLQLAGPQAGASKIIITASDGYETSLDLAAVQACPECLLAFTDTEGSYVLAMPGFESSAWAKDLIKIEVK
jgi:DMSO/TMAO reductase YedYZ molybdopterin-dependent catalytic subunit